MLQSLRPPCSHTKNKQLSYCCLLFWKGKKKSLSDPWTLLLRESTSWETLRFSSRAIIVHIQESVESTIGWVSYIKSLCTDLSKVLLYLLAKNTPCSLFSFCYFGLCWPKPDINVTSSDLNVIESLQGADFLLQRWKDFFLVVGRIRVVLTDVCMCVFVFLFTKCNLTPALLPVASGSSLFWPSLSPYSLSIPPSLYPSIHLLLPPNTHIPLFVSFTWLNRALLAWDKTVTLS